MMHKTTARKLLSAVIGAEIAIARDDNVTAAFQILKAARAEAEDALGITAQRRAIFDELDAHFASGAFKIKRAGAA